ncbi:MAG: radical SAM protein [Polyangiaceae bacterium]
MLVHLGRVRALRAELIRPPSVVARFGLTLNATPPLGVCFLAAALREAGHDVGVVDAVGLAPDTLRPGFAPSLFEQGLSLPEVVARLDPTAELIGVSCAFSHEWPVARRLIALLRERFPNATIVCGGEHPTAAPEHCLETAPELDACALGEGEETIVELARAVATGQPLGSVAGLMLRIEGTPQRTLSRARIKDLHQIALPAWDAIPIDTYLDRGFSFGVQRGRTMAIFATRGCPYQCTFCSSPQMWTTRYATRDPAHVVDEINLYVEKYRAENIDFYDLTAILRKDWIIEFCRMLVERKLPVTWQLPSGTRSEAIDAEVVGWLYKAGCRNISYAPESGSERVLRSIKKKIRPSRMLESMTHAVRGGLNVKANILIGFPDERRSDLLDTLRFIGQMASVGVHDVSVWTFSPYPGSEIYAELVRRGRIRDLDDEYFASLLSYSDLVSAVSYADELSARELELCRLAGLGYFYGRSYATRPARPLRLARNLATGRLESRLEMSLANLGRRLLQSGAAERA